MKSFKRPTIYLQKIIALLMVLILTFSTCSCSFKNTGKNTDNSEEYISESYSSEDNEDFAAFTKEFFCEIVSEDCMTLHAFIEHPENYRIKDYDVTLGRYDFDSLDDTSDITGYINRLMSFDKNTLSAKQQITYDYLLQYLQTLLEYSDLYLFSSQLTTTTGIQIQLPILFEEYPFIEKKDIDEYITLLEDVDGFFENLIEYEKLRSSNGYFMEDTLADEVIESCKSIISSAKDESQGMFIPSFNAKIDAFQGLTDDERNNYKEKNKAAVLNHVVKGYQALIDGLTSLKGTNKYKGGLCNYPNGQKYFESVLAETLGWSKSVSEFDKLVDKYMSTYMASMQTILIKDTSLIDKADSFKFNLTDPTGILEDLKKRIKDDYPEIPEVNYDIKYISKALEDYASPAMYFIPQIDNLNINSIYVNSGDKDSGDIYPTLAHEGYPGHLYQTQYYAATNPDYILQILRIGGYVEGWASYVEVHSYEYADSNSPELNTLMSNNYATILCIYAKGDIGVNYYGWNEDQLAAFLKKWGYNNSSIAHEMYYSFIADPGNYCKYVLGFLGFEELRNHAQSCLGDKFDLKSFHKFVLDMGPVQFDILFSNLEKWEAEQNGQG